MANSVFDVLQGSQEHRVEKMLLLLDLPVPTDSMSSRFEPGVPDEQPFSNMFLPSDNWEDDWSALIDNGDLHTPSQEAFVGVSQTIGHRRTMEDAFIVLGDLGVFGVFDGHGGDEAARIASRTLKRELASCGLAGKAERAQAVIDSIHGSVVESTASGTTATLCFVDAHTITIANVGDSPAFVRTADGCVKVSEDHTAANPVEEERVRAMGGRVINVYGMKRVGGVSAVSRAIGDRKMQPFLHPTAHVITMERSAVECVVLASDGVTDVVSVDEIDAVVSTIRNEAAAATIIRNLAFSKGSRDNITCMVVRVTPC